MPSSLFSLNLGTVATAALASLIGSTTAHFDIDTSFKIDVHSHAIPSRWYNALIEAGYPVTNGTLYVDKFPVSGTWDITSHLAAMDTNGLNYSTLSVSAPGVTFLYDDAAAALQLAQLINDEMYNYTQQYPDRLGAMCLLPLPHINESLTEIARCLDCLNFDGIGMYTNFHGLYLGNRTLDPIMSLIEEKNATVFVHPSAPSCAGAAIGYPDPMSEYPFDSVRAMENLLLAGQRAAFPDINIIFPHGGGAMPYLGGRIAGISSLSFLGGLSVATSVAQFQNYFFDTASATSVVQLVAMNAFGGIKKIVTGTDYPYVPLVQSTPALAAIKTNGGYTDDEMALINNQNVLGIFPRIVAKLGLTSSNTTTV